MKQFLELIGETLEKELDTISPQDVFRDYDEWDSLAHLSMISIIDETYGLVIPRDEFAKLTTLEQVYDYITKNTQN